MSDWKKAYSAYRNQDWVPDEKSFEAGFIAAQAERDAYAKAMQAALEAGIFLEKESLKETIANFLTEGGVKL